MTADKITDSKALVVDNNPVIVKLVSSILREEGCLVRTAVDGLEAIDIIDRFRPDIVFTDLVMPGIDGMKLCHIIRNIPEYKDIFIVVISAVALEDDTDLLEIGADICIAKGTAVNMRRHIIEVLHSFCSGKRDFSHEIQGVAGLHPREVTRELLINKRHHEVVFEQMEEGYLELDDKGRILRVNSACCRILQLEEAEILARHFGKLLPKNNDEDLNKWLENLYVQGISVPLVFDYNNPVILHNRYITFKLVPVKDENRFTVIGVIEDVSRRKEMAERQEELEREISRMRTLEALTGMAGGIAHDFNNLLTVINGNVEMAHLLSTDEKVASLLKEAEKALKLTNDLVRRFSQFSDNYSPEKTLICIDDLLTDIIERELAGTKIKFTFINDGEKHTSILSGELIAQGFQNIIINAVEAMKGEGKLTVSLSAVNSLNDPGWVEQLKEGTKYVHITIDDAGAGMNQETLDKVFVPYFSSKQRGNLKGMGLGLTMAHSAIIRHGGLLRLDSVPRQGCKVTVYLPLTSSIHLE